MNLRRFVSLAVGITSICLVSPLPLLRADAPESLKGHLVCVVISSGEGAFESSGAYWMLFETISDFVAEPLTPNIESFNGTYSYTRTGTNTATMSYAYSLLGISVTKHLIFESDTFAIFGVVNSVGQMDGTITFVIRDFSAGDLAPESLAGMSFLNIVYFYIGSTLHNSASRRVYSSDGVTSTSSPIADGSPGGLTFTYKKTSPTEATITHTDLFGTANVVLDTVFVEKAVASYESETLFFTAKGVLIMLPSVVPPTEPRLVNLSVRAVVPTSSNVIPGFVIEGGQQTVLIRAAGPALAEWGVPDTLANPKLTVYSGDNPIASNDDWTASSQNKAECVAAGTKVGAFDFLDGSRDAAIVVTLDPGPYTVLVSGDSGTAGEILLEVYGVPED